MKILVVEDNRDIAQAVENVGAQICVECATDGWDAIEKLEHERYDAIVIDTDLPRHSGFGVLTYLREEIGDDLGNVIVMTSSDRDEMQRKLHVKVVAKKSDDLNEAVRNLAHRS